MFIFKTFYATTDILCYFMLLTDPKLDFMIFWNFMPNEAPAIQAFELISVENYYLSKFTFNKQVWLDARQN